MNRSIFIVFMLIAAVSIAKNDTVNLQDTRDWSSGDEKMTGRFVGVIDENVVIKNEDGLFEVNIKNLTDDDKNFLDQNFAENNDKNRKKEVNIQEIEKDEKLKKKLQKFLKPTDFNFWSSFGNDDIVFNYAQNNGTYSVGDGYYLFNIHFSARGADSIYMYADTANGEGIAVAYNAIVPAQIMDFKNYDFSEDVKAPHTGQYVIMRNIVGNFVVVRINGINTKTNLVSFSYNIMY